MFALSFNTDGDTFRDSDGNEDPEIKRLVVADYLEQVVEDLRDGHSERVIRDANGNTIGSWSLT